jgi:5-methylcytosine-specific restriction endonuclease McrA
VAGKSKAEVEAYVAQYRPKSKIKEGIKPVTITPKKSEDTPVMPLLFLGDQKSLAGDSPEIRKDTAVCTGTTAAPVVEQYAVRFLADRELIDKYREAEAILSGKYRGKAAPALVISELLECFLEKYSPARRQARRQRAAKSDNRNLEQRSPATPPAAATAAVTRSIRDAVLMRDGRRCSYVGPGGKRCNARHNLQVDHIIPRAFGGGNELGNLRCLCKTHNLFMAKELIGRSYMSKFTKTRAVAETVNDSSI